MDKRKKKIILRATHRGMAISLLMNKVHKNRDFKRHLEGAIEYAAWKILADMEAEVEGDGIPINDVLYYAVEEVARETIRRMSK